MRLDKGFVPFVTTHYLQISPNSIAFVNGMLGPFTAFVQPEDIEFILDILRYCDGANTVAEIECLLPFRANDDVNRLLGYLQENGIIIDQSERDQLFRKWARLTVSGPFSAEDALRAERAIEAAYSMPKRPMNPGKNHLLPSVTGSHLLGIARCRKSTREFAPITISKAQLGGLLEKGYGQRTNHSVPSGGGFYDLLVFVYLPKPIEDLPQGLYEYNPETLSIISLAHAPEFDQVRHMYIGDPHMVINASAMVFVAGDTHRSNVKYGIRAFQLQLIEAGAVLGGMYDFCAENGLGCVALGGVNDEIVGELLGFNGPQQYLATCLVVGIPSAPSSAQ